MCKKLCKNNNIVLNYIYNNDHVIIDLFTPVNLLDYEDNESDVTGRGKTNNGYENINIDTEYFTPPKANSIPIQIPRKNSYTTPPSSVSSLSDKGSYGKSKGFLSSSIEKISSFFMQKK